MIQIDEHIFQKGWNHQIEEFFVKSRKIGQETQNDANQHFLHEDWWIYPLE